MADKEKLIDKEKFRKRLSKFYEFWNANEHDALNTVDSVSICFGSSDDAGTYSKSGAVHVWLFGYELPDTLMLLCKGGVYFLSSKKKVDFLKPIETEEDENGLPPIKCLVRDKSDHDKANFTQLIEFIEGSRDGKTLGEFSKEKHSSDFTKGWQTAVKEKELQTADVSTVFALIMASKDATEIPLVKQACNATCLVWNKFMRKRIVEIIDDESKVRHEKLSEECEGAFADRKVVGGMNVAHLDSCYTPIIQSGGNYSLKVSASSDTKYMQFDAVLCSLGGRYYQYCSNVSRTMLVEPAKSVEKAYDLLLSAEQAIIDNLKPGAKLSEVYEAAVAVVREQDPNFVDKMPRTLGFATGIEFRESSLVIGPKSAEKVKEGMVFVVHCGFANVPNPAAKTDATKSISLLVSDTMLVNESGAECLTEAAKRKTKSIAIRFKEDDDEEEKENNKQKQVEEILGRGKRSVVLQDQTRNKQTNEEKRKEHQRELAEQLNKEAKERIARAKDKAPEQKVKKTNVSYKSVNSLPDENEVRTLRVYVDKRHETVVLPIFGVPVPFHISMIKNAAESVEGQYTYLRINFFHPGANFGKDNNVFPNPLATFLKELTYRSTNQKEPGELHAPSLNLNTAFRLIKELQKKYRTHEAEEREKEGTIKQDKLLLSQNKGNPRLKDLYVRPNIVSKRISGTLEAHLNGFEFSLRGDKLDLLYNNIKHAFYQPCNKEMIILLHFRLKFPVLFGKKKLSDIQFYTEVGEITTDLGKYHHMQDRDDIYAEQAERELRQKLNTAFKSFTEKVDRQTNGKIDFESPFRDLGFHGVPHRQVVLLQPTSGCLVSLIDWPTFVVTLEDVELVHFERVSFQLKNFDMVFVYKEYNRKPDMVQQVPTTMLDHVKEWLNSMDIRYTEGIQSLNWTKIMKTIVDDPQEFFDGGGWNFLDAEGAQNEEEEEDSDDSEDAYNPSSGDSEQEEEEESEEDEETPEPTSESESDASVGSEESEGKDWSDLEKEALSADRERDRDVGDTSHRHKRKHSSSPHKKKSSRPPHKRRK